MRFHVGAVIPMFTANEQSGGGRLDSGVPLPDFASQDLYVPAAFGARARDANLRRFEAAASAIHIPGIISGHYARSMQTRRSSEADKFRRTCRSTHDDHTLEFTRPPVDNDRSMNSLAVICSGRNSSLRPRNTRGGGRWVKGAL